MIIFFTIFLLLGGITVIPETSFNKILYVDDDNTKGPWDGTIEYPYQYIQDAINIATSGDIIRIYEGIYNNSKNNVDISKTLTIIGNGSFSTFIKRPISINADWVNISGLSIDGFDFKTFKKACCIKLQDSKYCRIQNNTIKTGLSNIEAYNSSYNYIVNNKLVGGSVDKMRIYLYSSNNNIIRNNQFDLNLGYTTFGIYLDYCYNTLIDNNTLYGSIETSSVSPYSIFLLSSCNNSIINNNITNGHCSLNMILSDYNEIKNNSMINHWIAINLEFCNNNIISNNIMSNLEYGLSFSYSSNNTIEKNEMMDSDGPYIGLFDESNHNIISQNRLVDNIWCGVVIYTSNNVIELNEIIKNGYGGIWIFEGARKNIIRQNTIQENGNNDKSWSGGIVFDRNFGSSEKSNDNTIYLNNIVNNINFGINLTYSNNNIIKNNNFIGNEKQAIFISALGNTWISNYWDEWRGFGPKIIFGRLGYFGNIPWINFDWRPAKEPYDIGG
jgi:parallel beta-helix repeat protein